MWKHVKTGGIYVIILDNVLREHDLVPQVVYMNTEDKKIWSRPREEFFDGRFEEMK